MATLSASEVLTLAEMTDVTASFYCVADGDVEKEEEGEDEEEEGASEEASAEEEGEDADVLEKRSPEQLSLPQAPAVGEM